MTATPEEILYYKTLGVIEYLTELAEQQLAEARETLAEAFK